MKRPLRTIYDRQPQPLWRGPYVDGITYSNLCRFICCRDRFHKRMILGIADYMDFDHKMRYGSLWHECEEAYARQQDWKVALAKYRTKLLQEYPGSEKKILYWSSICQMQFAIYLDFWRNHYTSLNRKWIYREEEFRVSYRLPSGRYIDLRGKIDGAFEQKGKFVIQENKTKGEIDQEAIPLCIPNNLQTGIYIIAAEEKRIRVPDRVLYNVIRRPLSDRYAIRRRKKESEKQFIKRLGGTIKAKPAYFFMRWPVDLPQKRIQEFRQECLNPHLEALCDWWDSIERDPFNPFKSPLHWRMPFGVFNALSTGFRGDYFELLTQGNRRNIVEIENLTPELSL
jgi:hypothetical protein